MFGFLIGLLVILIVVQSLGFILFISSVRGDLVNALNDKVDRTGALLAEIGAEPVLNNDSGSLDSYLERVFSDEDFTSIVVYDRDGNIIAQKTRAGRIRQVANPFYAQMLFSSETPVLMERQKIGNIEITASSGRINNEIFRHQLAAVIHQGVLSVIIVIFVLFFFRIHIKKPVSDLISVINRLVAGDLTVKMPAAKSLEIEDLTKSFNAMTGQVKGTLKKLYSTTNDVSMAIQQIKQISDKVIEGTDNQLAATQQVVASMASSDDAEKDILANTQNLSEFSEENLSSLMEIKSTSEEITESSEQLYKASSDSYSTIAELVAAAKAISKSAEELSVSTEQISASIEQINANTNEVDESTRDSAVFAAKVREIASEQGMLSVADAMGGMEEITNAVDTTLQLVRDLKLKSKSVEKVLSVIDDVTKQTNLLSVNAAILASQAGEYGKGFSVVADEIKTLADRTSASAKEITGIIKAIQRGVTQTTNVTESTKIIVERGNSLVIKTGEAFRDVINSAQQSSEMADRIHNAIAEQVRGISQIKEAMEMIMEAVGQVTGATHEHEIGSEHLIGVAENVKGIAEVIKKSMQEQTAGISLISKNLELANGKIRQIVESTSRHGRANEEILFAAEEIGGVCSSTHMITQDMISSFETLHKEAEALKKYMDGFKFE
ncbi:methyl-accepting chemotaxis protein McpA [bacterium BMS3Abin10]|nr:methyl-accepting chemotaxis protein McpA [bacterium BMS3Abin10]GBE38736.1 methyl-accepting chemotaxis protein McpA [bacterium BMS3Bbin08]